MELNENRLIRAIDDCYEAIVEPEKWPDALQSLAGAAGADCAMFYPKDVNQDALRVPSSRSYAELLEHYVQGGWYQNHYRAERGWPLMRSRRFVLEQHLSTEEERRTLRHYNELYLRWGYPGFIAIPFAIDGHSWCLPMLRGQDRGFFTEEEGARLAVFAPHFRRMMLLTARFSWQRAGGGLESLEKIDKAALVLDWQGRVRDLNAKARALLARAADALFLNGGGHLHAVQPDSENRLQALFALLQSRDRRDRRLKEAHPVRMERPGHRPLLVEAVSLEGMVPFLSAARSLLLIIDLGERPVPVARQLRVLLQLTPAEAELCVELASGRTLAKAAERLRITAGTARQRLKDIFHKTGTHRQSELVALLSRLPGSDRNGVDF